MILVHECRNAVSPLGSSPCARALEIGLLASTLWALEKTLLLATAGNGLDTALGFPSMHGGHGQHLNGRKKHECTPINAMATPVNTSTATPAIPVDVNSSSLLPPVPALDNTFGAVLLGTCFGLILYGLTAHQAYRYFRLYPNDASVLKGLGVHEHAPGLSSASGARFLETLHTALCIHMCYYYLTTNYFNPLALLSGVWSLRLVPVVTVRPYGVTAFGRGLIDWIILASMRAGFISSLIQNVAGHGAVYIRDFEMAWSIRPKCISKLHGVTVTGFPALTTYCNGSKLLETDRMYNQVMFSPIDA
ncbi:hypothetical protein OH77DRAFT_1437933 [Trametes cingulata]|nr:hypothetical protein OH77DRAFT_1437933 [Trametes cingulata]